MQRWGANWRRFPVRTRPADAASPVPSCCRRFIVLAAAACALAAVGPLRAQLPRHIADEARRRNNLGVALMDEGAKDPKYFVEAVREFEGALRVSPAYPLARVNLGIALYYAGRTRAAEAALQDALRVAGADLRAEYVLGLLREYDGEFGAAAEHFRRVASRDAADADAWYHLGFCLSKSGRHEEAIEPLRRAAALVPYARRIRYALYMTLSRAGRGLEAERELEAFRGLEATQVRVVNGPKNALAYLEQGSYAEALADSRMPAPAPPPARYEDATARSGLPAATAPLDPQVESVLDGTAIPSSALTPALRARIARALGVSVALADMDHDGRLDAAWIRHGRTEVFVQRASGRFTKAAVPASSLSVRTPSALAWGDVDNDGWADLVIGGDGVTILWNRAGRLTGDSRKAGRFPPYRFGAASLSLADVDHDGDLDILLVGGVRLDRHGSRNRVRYPEDFEPRENVLLRNNGTGTFANVAAAAGIQATVASRAAWFTDLDGDRAVDVVLVDVHGLPHVLINRKDGTFSADSVSRAVDVTATRPGEAVAFGDMNGDGAIDRLLVDRTGIRLEQNTQPRAHWVTVRVAGYAAPGKVKSNALGIGTRVEVRSAGRWERREIRAGNGMNGSDAPEATFDLGPDARLDFVRAMFPSGVRKTLTNVPAGQTIVIEEPLLDVNSCPTLFTWDGRRFTFVTDTISAGILGELVAPGEYWAPDPDEWVRIGGEQLVPAHDGSLEIRFTNPLEEVTYLDNVKLMAVDHPAGVDVYSDERMLGDAGSRQVRLYALRDARPVVRATDHEGHDVTAALRVVDRQYVDHFSPRPFKGFAGEWALTLDVGPRQGLRTALGLHGWSYWNSSASVVAAAQTGETLHGPALDVLGSDGRWREAAADLGVPAGLPRPVVIELTPYLKPGEHVIRIRANRTVYYDRAWIADIVDDLAIAPGAASGTMQITEAPRRSAELRWLGYPRRILPDGRLPEVFDYDQIESGADWATPAGFLTRYGAVDALLHRRDDRFVVMGHGEEVGLAFSSESLPALPAVRRRTWFFYADGFEKGSELYSASGDSVGPLPYHGMPSYPTNDRAVGAADISYLLDWNTRPSFMRGR
jgi:Flp pilus assembly protein TadD